MAVKRKHILIVFIFVLVLIGIVIFASFLLFSQLVYPKVYSTRKIKEIDRNLIPALQDMMVQLSSGIPLFNILVNIASSDYSALSD